MATTQTPTATVLVVEGRREVLDVLQRTLSDNGYSVLTADDGDSGLQMALDHRPDLVILDIGLPKRREGSGPGPLRPPSPCPPRATRCPTRSPDSTRARTTTSPSRSITTSCL